MPPFVDQQGGERKKVNHSNPFSVVEPRWHVVSQINPLLNKQMYKERWCNPKCQCNDPFFINNFVLGTGQIKKRIHMKQPYSRGQSTLGLMLGFGLGESLESGLRPGLCNGLALLPDPEKGGGGPKYGSFPHFWSIVGIPMGCESTLFHNGGITENRLSCHLKEMVYPNYPI